MMGCLMGQDCLNLGVPQFGRSSSWALLNEVSKPRLMTNLEFQKPTCAANKAGVSKILEYIEH
jgi:hypothetical protein